MREPLEPIIEKRFSCPKSCPLNQTGLSFFELLKHPDPWGEIGSVTVSQNGPTRSFPLRFAPTGNFVPDPYVVICGKTADRRTQEKFWLLSKEGDPAAAAHELIFSTPQTRTNLFKELVEIDLFNLLRTAKPDNWDELSDQEVWKRLFQRDYWRDDYGIQLTQACNCAILQAGGRRPSQQPTKTTVKAIVKQNPSCLFNGFPDPDRLTNLKLVVFLDTRAEDSQFHPEDFFENSELGRSYQRLGIKIISIPHPAGLFYGKPSAARLLTAAKETIAEITKQLNTQQS